MNNGGYSDTAPLKLATLTNKNSEGDKIGNLN